jgi:hypothetical protein
LGKRSDGLGDERFEEVHEALALYSPFEGPPYVQAPDLRERLTEALRLLGDE